MAPAVTANLTTFATILKDLYLGPVREQLNSEVFLFQRLATNTDMLVGNRAYVPLHKTRTGGIGARAEDTTLPSPTAQGYDKAVFDVLPFYGVARVTGLGMAKTKSQAGAFLEMLKSEIDGLRTDLKKDMARQVYGDGTGVIATCGTTTAANAVVLGTDEPIRKGQLYVGMVVDVLVKSTGATSTGCVAANISDVSVANKTITIVDGSGSAVNVTTDNTFGVYRSGNRNQEINGLSKLLPQAANTLGGIDASAAGNGYWDNLRLNVNGALSQDIMLQAAGQQRIAGEEASLLLTTFGIRRQYFNLLQSQVRYTEPTKLSGGFESLDFNGKPLVADVDATFGSIYYLVEKHFQVYQTEDWHFLDQDNSPLKWAQNKDAWLVYLARYMNIGTDRRNTSLVAYGITGDTKGY